VRRIGVERFGTVLAELTRRYAALLHAAAQAPRAGAHPSATAAAAALPSPPPLPPAAAVQVAASHLFALHEVSQPPAHTATATTTATALPPPPPPPSLLVPPVPLPPLLPLALTLALRWLGDTLRALPRSMVRPHARALACRSPRAHHPLLPRVLARGALLGPEGVGGVRSGLAASRPTKKVRRRCPAA
jgi:hypothetical protein